MTDYVFAPPAVPSVEIAGCAARFAVRRVFCVGRNYADHAREMGADPNREPPFFFTKPADAIVPASGTVPYPTLTSELHHEIELVIAIGRGGRAIAADAALAAQLKAACARFVDDEGETLNARFRLHGARVHAGLIVSGDRFVSSEREVSALRDALPDALAVEMEGAALAQVCHEYGVPCAIVRTISDTADDHASTSFTTFLTDIAGAYSSGILKRFLAAHAWANAA